MENKIKQKIARRRYLLVSILLLVFCVLKVLRGADTESTQAGGFWNYISLFYYPLLLVGLFNFRSFKPSAVFAAPLIYSALAMAFALCTSDIHIKLSWVYAYLMIPYFLLVFSVFYMYAEDWSAGNNFILTGYFICLAINLWSCVKFLFLGGAQAMASDIYYSLGLFPFALTFLKNKKLKNFLFVLQFAAVFLSDKRAGLIAFAIGTVIYFLASNYYSKKRNIVKTITTLVVLAVAIYAFYRISMYIDARFKLGIYERLFGIKEDDGSGRGIGYRLVWKAFLKSSFIEKIFGHGMNTAGAVAGYGKAHNDFLEILYDYGFFACICIVVFFVAPIVRAIKMLMAKSPYAPAFLFSLVTGIFLSLFSYFVVFYTYVTCITAFWGYSLAMEKKRLLVIDKGQIEKASTRNNLRPQRNARRRFI